MPPNPITERDRKYLEETGVENVRIALLTNTNLAIADRGVAWRWLKEQDEKTGRTRTFYDRTNLKITTLGTIAATIAAIASVWALFR
jgi:hypothetical protein